MTKTKPNWGEKRGEESLQGGKMLALKSVIPPLVIHHHIF